MGEGRTYAQQSRLAQVPGNKSVVAKRTGKPARAPPQEGAAAKTARWPDLFPLLSMGIWVCLGMRFLRAPWLWPAC